MEKKKPRKILDNKYIIKKRLGYGAQGEVFLVEKIEDHNEYVAKIINEQKCSEYEKSYFRNEIEILELLSNEEKKYVPHLYAHGEGYVKYEGEKEEELIKRDYFIMNYAKNRDLFHYLEKGPRGLKEVHVKLIFKKILEGILYCHSKNICHLDIKTQNILLDEIYNPLIIDFGLSSYIFNQNGNEVKKKDRVGTLYYMCPEMVENKPYFGIDADIFSLGVLLFKLVTGEFGFKIASVKDNFYQYIMMKHIATFWEKKSAIKPQILDTSEEFKKLFINMVSCNPKNRPRIEQILKGDWMKEINYMSEDQLNKLNDEIIEEFMRIEDEIEKQNEFTQKTEDKESYDTLNKTRGTSSEEVFGENIKIKKIKKGEKFANNYIKIKGYLNPIKFMNSLLKEINENYSCNYEYSENKLKFIANFEIGQEFETNNDLGEMDNFCMIKIKMYKDEEGGYFVNFIKLQGQLDDYYELFLGIREIIKKLLN